MQEITTARERILKSIRNANLKVDKNEYKDIDHDTSIYPKMADDKLISFAESFNANGGQFVYCTSESELAANILAWKNKNQEYTLFLKDKSLQQFCQHYKLAFTDQISDSPFRASIILADFLVARTGSIAVSASKGGSRAVNISSNKLLVIAYADQITEALQDSLIKTVKGNDEKSSFYSYISGPSQSNAIENSFEVGMYGPSEIILFLLESN